MGRLQGLSLLISVWFLAFLIVASIILVTKAKRKFTKILGVVVIIGSVLLVVFEFMQFSAYLEMCSSDRRYEYSEVKHLGGFIERTFFVEMNENMQDIELVETYRYSPTLEHRTIVLEANVQNLELFLTENINIPTHISACTCPCEACMDCEQQSIDVLEPEISEYPIYGTGNYSLNYSFNYEYYKNNAAQPTRFTIYVDRNFISSGPARVSIVATDYNKIAHSAVESYIFEHSWDDYEFAWLSDFYETLGKIVNPITGRISIFHLLIPLVLIVVISESGVIKNSNKNKNETNKNASNNDKK